MRSFEKHTLDAECPGCADRLKEADQYLRDWFNFEKKKFPTMHVSWAYRDEENQNEAYADGASKLKFPYSKHNALPSQALDIFQIDQNKRAVFDPIFCAKLNDDSIKCGYSLRWGGSPTFLGGGDSGHFEMA